MTQFNDAPLYKDGVLTAVPFRLFLTCWIIFSLHFGTNFVREHYLVVSMVEDGTFRLDPYADMHVDIFETPEHGAHHGANPGASMIAAIPYFFFSPIVDQIVAATRPDPGDNVSAVYEDPREARRVFYQQARERGLDIRFGLVGIITLVFCMAPLSALSAVVMYRLLLVLGVPRHVVVWLALLYAFGTPIFFRTHYLNQNLMVGLFAFFAFVLLWKSEILPILTGRWRLGVAGFLSGLAVLCDYSGLVVLAVLGCYILALGYERGQGRQMIAEAIPFSLGAAGPILVLWFYQWASFGFPFYPPQHYMPPVAGIEVGYQGVGFPTLELVSMLLFDPRCGLFVTAPILLLGFLLPLLRRHFGIVLPRREGFVVAGMALGFVLFFGGVEYTRLQWLTGIRYLVPVIPFLFIPAALFLTRLPKVVAYMLGVGAVAQAWAAAMVTDEFIQKGVIATLKAVFLQGLQLPWMTTLQKMSNQYLPDLQNTSMSPIPFFLLAAAIIYGIWRFPLPDRLPFGRRTNASEPASREARSTAKVLTTSVHS